MRFDIIIKNGRVFDGSNNPSQNLDIGIKGNKITETGQICPENGETVIDAANKLVAPGFIDIHSHSDFLWLIHPESNSKVYDGVTTEICGNCGSSPFPLAGKLLEHRQKGFAKFGLNIDWNTPEEFYELAVSKKSSINRGFLTGHGNLRACAMGYEDRAATNDDIAKMKNDLIKALKNGAFGMSSGIAYPPGCYSSSSELKELCQIVKEYQGIYTTHMRDEADMVEAALKETIEIARDTGVALQISHIKTAGKKNWAKLPIIKGLLMNAKSSGVKLNCDRYPYIASSTDLDAIFPKWAYEGGIDKEIKRLKDSAQRARIKEETAKNNDLNDEFWKSIVISTVLHEKNRNLEGKNILEVSQERKNNPFDTACDLLIEEDARVDVLFFNMSESNLEEILKWDFVMIGSDSSIRSTNGILHDGKPHPRSYGTFSRVLAKFCREDSALTKEEAIYKMTGLPATKLGLTNRGIIKTGYHADIVIFDDKNVKDQSTFATPHQYSTGIEHVIVNGKVTINNGEHTGEVEGKILRRK